MIRFHYRYPAFRIPQAQLVKNWLQKVSEQEHQVIASLHYIFTDDQEILHLNKQALQHDYYTDILTFPSGYAPIEGEIYISIDRIKEQAREYHVTFNQELMRVMVHGLLHLCLYEDSTPAQKKIMTSQEDHYLKMIFNK